MAGNWIKMKCGLRHDPKVIAIARYLTNSETFVLEYITQPANVTHHVTRHVTSRVTFGVVTRVTVAALLDVWSALNNSLGSDGKAPFMNLQDIDDISEIPDFGKAMASVGWVIELQAGGLMFPNFSENNSPSKSRPTNAKSDAERAKEYRARKRKKNDLPDAVTASRHVTTDKRREDIKRERESAGAIEEPPTEKPDVFEQAQTIVGTYPRKEKIADALTIVAGQLKNGENFETMLSGTKAAAAVIRTLPSGHANRYVPAADNFFRAKRWADDPETLRRQGNTQNGSKPMTDEEAMTLLGGRASNND